MDGRYKNSFCKLCADEGKSCDFVSLEVVASAEIRKILTLFDFDFDVSAVCSTCVSTIQHFNDFIQYCRKAQNFLAHYRENEQETSKIDDIQKIRLQFGLDVQIVKDEFTDSCDQVEALDCDDSSFNALDQSLTDTNFALQETIEDFDSLAEHTTDFRCKTIKTSLDENAQLLLSCSQCSKRFDNEKRLKIHLATHEKKIFSCEYCDKKFTKSVNVQAHVKSIHQLEKNFLCSDCGKNFSTKGALKEHQIIHQNIYPYQCNICPKKFKNLPRLKTHADTHNNTKYICSLCGISLNTKRTLKMHMVVHSDFKKYKCQYCASSFKRSKALKNHLILHSGLRPYSCEFCEKTFANGSNCRSHKKKSHPVELAALEASGKTAAAARTIIPRLDQLQPKMTVDEDKQKTEHNLQVHLISKNFKPQIDKIKP